MPTNADKVLELAERKGILRSRDLLSLGIPRVTLTRLERAGRLERVGRGLHTLPGADVTEHDALAEACRRVTHGIVCLLSALREYRSMRKGTVDELWEAADVGRVKTVIRPYLEALA